MTGPKKYGYVYGGKASIKGQVRPLEGTAWSLGQCDEVKLRAAAVRDLAQIENVPLAGIEINEFWFSEIVAEADLPHPCTDPFRPRGVPEDRRDTPDPFRPGDS
jgi:hypothetical protein